MATDKQAIALSQPSYKQALKYAVEQLNKRCDTPELDAQLLLQHTVKESKTQILTWPDSILNDDEYLAFKSYVSRRLQGEPVAYITGRQGFWDFTVSVNQHTLIPRPDTEVLIETVESIFNKPPSSILDLGTGTGVIAIALARIFPNANVIAIERDENTFVVAAKNIKSLSPNVQLLCGSWYEPVNQKFDLICSNPPYIESNDKHLDALELGFEPRDALVSGEDGLDDLRHIIINATKYLNKGGYLLVEHGFDQQMAVQNLFKSAGFSNIETKKDYGNNDRVSLGQYI